MTAAVHTWWVFLWIVAVLNIAAWNASALALGRGRHRHSTAGYRQARLLLWLSAVYTAGCAFRSFLPRIDLERICLAESWLSRMVVGRSVATVAELCFAVQFALLLRRIGGDARDRFSVTVSLLLIPLIVVAEFSSWYAVMTTNYLGHVLENSIWTFCAALFLASLVSLWLRGDRQRRRILATMMVFALGYIVFMATVDVPMYWSRWIADRAAGVGYLSLFQGLVDASQQCVVSFDWEIWHEEVPWMTLYFTVGVWVSFSLPHAAAWMNGPSRTSVERR